MAKISFSSDRLVPIYDNCLCTKTAAFHTELEFSISLFCIQVVCTELFHAIISYLSFPTFAFLLSLHLVTFLLFVITVVCVSSVYLSVCGVGGRRSYLSVCGVGGRVH